MGVVFASTFSFKARSTLAHLVDLSWSRTRHGYLLVSHQHTGTPRSGGKANGEEVGRCSMKNPADFPVLLESFFTQRLIAQRRASPHTIVSYRDTFRLLLHFAQKRLHKAPSRLAMEDLNAPFVSSAN